MSKNSGKSVKELFIEASVPEEKQPYKVPNNWVWVRSEDVAKWGSGGTPSRKNPDYYKGNIPWIKTGELRDGIITEVGEYITTEAIKKSSAKIYPKGSVAIAMYGATIGKVGILGLDAATNQACAVGTPGPLTNSKYMYYYFRTQKDSFINLGKGGAQPNISQSLIKNYPFPLPPLNEQKRITDKVERILDKINRAKQLIAVAKETFELGRAAILEKAFRGELTDIKYNQKKPYKITSSVTLDIPDCWELKPLKMVVDNFNTKRIPITKDKRAKGDVPYYGATGIVDYVDGYTHDGNFVLIGEDGANLLSRSKNQSYQVNGKVWVNNHAHVLKMKGNMCDDYLMHYLNYLPLNDFVTGTAQPKLNRSNLDKILIPIPSDKEQVVISRKINELLERETMVQKMSLNILEELNVLGESILQKAFRGEIGTNNSREETIHMLGGTTKKN